MRGAELAFTVTHERPHTVDTVCLAHVDLHAREGLAKATDHRVHRLERERRNLKRAVSQLCHAANRITRLVAGAQNVLGRAEKRLTGGSQASTTVHTVKQADVKLTLERTDRL